MLESGADNLSQFDSPRGSTPARAAYNLTRPRARAVVNPHSNELGSAPLYVADLGLSGCEGEPSSRTEIRQEAV